MSVGGYLTIYTLLFLVIFSRCFYFSRSFVFPSFIIHCRSSVVALWFIAIVSYFSVALLLFTVVFLSFFYRYAVIHYYLAFFYCYVDVYCYIFSHSSIVMLLFIAISSVVLFILFYSYQEIASYLFLAIRGLLFLFLLWLFGVVFLFFSIF